MPLPLLPRLRLPLGWERGSSRRTVYRGRRGGHGSLTWAQKLHAPAVAVADLESWCPPREKRGRLGEERGWKKGDGGEKPRGGKGREDAAAAAESPRSPSARPVCAAPQPGSAAAPPRLLPAPHRARPAPPRSAAVDRLALPPPQCPGGGAQGPASCRSQPAVPPGQRGWEPGSPAQPRPRAAAGTRLPSSRAKCASGTSRPP